MGNGRIKRFAANGTLLQTLDNTTGSQYQSGMCFDANGNMYSTNFSNSSVSKFDNNGVLVKKVWASSYQHQESCVVDANGNVFTGEADGEQLIRKFAPNGTALATFPATTTDRGTDWIDLAKDQCTMFYTSEGGDVKRYNVCTKTQLANFATGLNEPCYALRIRGNGEVMVGCETEAVRLSATGAVVKRYPVSGYPNGSSSLSDVI